MNYFIMRKLILLIIPWNFALILAEDSVHCPINENCEKVQTSNLVRKYCQQQKWIVDGRCCFNSSNSHDIHNVIGLDLEKCGIQHLDEKLKNFTQLHILSLLDNPIENTTKEAFTGLNTLEILYVPFSDFCPGGKNAWESIVNESYGWKCADQKDPCVYLNVSCTSAGDCHHMGPGIAKCQCLDGYYGYKCLRQGEFPVLFFSLAILLPTFILSLFLWCTQRKHVKLE